MLPAPGRRLARSELRCCPFSQVTAGTVNYEGALTIRASSTGQDSTLAGIAALVAEAQVHCNFPNQKSGKTENKKVSKLPLCC